MHQLRHRAVIAGYSGFGNTGDDAILLAMLDHLREAGGEHLRFTVIGGDQTPNPLPPEVETLSWSNPAAIAASIQASSLVILGGGGLFHDYWGFNPDLLLTEDHWGLSLFAAPAILAALHRKPLILYAVGVGPLFSEHGRRFTRVIAELAALITVRDPDSRRLLESLGIPKDRVAITADPAFALPLALPPPSPHTPPRVAVALRNWSFGVDQSFWEQEVARALDLFLDQTGGEAVLIPFQASSDPHEDDLSVARRLHAQLRHRNRCSVIEETLSPLQTAARLAEVDLVLGMRLHALIFAISAGVPCVALSYDPKVASVMEMAGLGPFSVGLGAVDAPHLASLMRRALHTPPASAHAGLAREAKRNALLALDLLHQESFTPPPPPHDFHDILRRSLETHIRLSQHLRAQLSAFEAQPHHPGPSPGSLAALSAERDALQTQLAELRSRLADYDALQTQLAELRSRLADYDALQTQLAELRSRLAGYDALQTQLQNAETRIRHLCHDLDLAWNDQRILEADAERDQLRTELRAARHALDAARHHLAQLQATSWPALSKRALHLLLDLAQRCTPELLRAAVRDFYLRHIYFRLFPERIPGPASAGPPPEEMPLLRVRSGYGPFLQFKRQLMRSLPADFSSLSSGGRPGLVSIVLPVYNGARFVRESIESVLGQTYPAWELIIVDDGSTDATPGILAAYAHHPQIKLLHQQNQKLPAALNLGFRHAAGEFLTWTSDDNRMLPDCLAELTAFLRAHPHVELVYADEEIIDASGQPALGSDFCPGYQTPPGSNFICWPRDPGELNFIQNNYLGGCFLYRAWAARIVGDYDPAKFGFEDYDYWMRFNALFRIAHLGLRKPLYQYRLHDASLSARDKELQITERVRQFMPLEQQRRRFFSSGADVTFLGSHPWFAQMAAAYRRAGLNVFVFHQDDPDQRYHYQVTRAWDKALLICGPRVLQQSPQLFHWLRSCSHPVVALLTPSPPEPDWASLADWIVATTSPETWPATPGSAASPSLLASDAQALLFPLLAAASVTAFARRS